MSQTLTPLDDDPRLTLDDRFADLPAYFDYKDVLTLFGHQEDLFVDAYCGDLLPPHVRRVILETMPLSLLTVFLLRRLVQQLAVPTEPPPPQ